ncbi:MBOAT family protein [Mucilaginibacter terrigena]|uniref:MBOAT family protein n=1 Tax=Mucilaginibacter terrigena TaxID=2492395 RepID=UPI001396AFA0|nr:MBOAT family protein [Mucilaginibacter terrigena]
MIYLLFQNEHSIMRMLTIIATTFTGMKVISVTQGYRNKPLTLTFKQWVVYAIGWVGMRAEPFETLGGRPLPNAWPMVRFGISRVVLGGLLILLAHILVNQHFDSRLTYITVSAILLVGLSLVLHFGLLGISAGMWRFSGVNTYYLFRQPAKALSLTELWSKRWNIAFSEMTSVAIFRPLKSRVGSGAALMAAFIFSGLLHELALSVPVSSGYGLPTLYFTIQGLLVLVEKMLVLKRITLFQNKIIARIWVFFWLVVPMPLLFHRQFLKLVVWPLAGLISPL